MGDQVHRSVDVAAVMESDRLELPRDPAEAALVAEHGGEDLTAKAAGGFVWALLGFLLLQVGSFGTYTVGARVLGEADLGVLATFMTIFLFADVLLDLGMGASIVYEQERGQSRRVDVAFTINTMVGVAVAAAVLAGAPLLAAFANLGDQVGLYRLLAVLVLAKSLNQIPDALLRREIDFRRRVVVDLARSLGRFAISVSLLLAGWGPLAMVVGVVSAEILATAMTWALVRFRPRLAMDRRIAGEMLRFGLATFGARATGMLWLNGDYLVVQGYYGGKSREMGEYYTAFKLPELIIGSVYALFSAVAFPAYAHARTQGEVTLRNASLRMTRLLTLFGFTAGIGMSLVAADFIRLWFGGGFEGAVRPMEIFGMAAGFAGIGFATGDLYTAIGRPKLGLYFNLVGTPIFLGAMLIAIPHGVAAAAMVHLIIIVPYSVFRLEAANRLIGTTWAQNFGALRAAGSSVAGMLLLALPVRLMLDGGPLRLALVVLTGALGAAVGVYLADRSTYTELATLGRKALRR